MCWSALSSSQAAICSNTACTEAPCLTVNYRYFHKISHDEADRLLDDLKAGRRSHEVPKHGTLGRVRQQIPADKRAGAAVPGECETPVWPASATTEAAES